MREAYRRLQERVARAAARSGRRDGEVAVVAVTKNASPDQIRLLVELGQADLGENRVQQLIQRVAMLEEFLSRKRMLGGSGEGPEKSEERRARERGGVTSVTMRSQGR